MTGALKEKYKIELEDDESALILGADGSLQFIIPEFDGGDVVPDHALLIVAIANRLEDDPDFAQELLEYLKDEVFPIENHGTA